MAAAAAAMANQMLQLRYSRKDELQADALGLRYMSQIGYDPSSMLEVMKILKEAASHGGGGSAIFSTHPDPDARIEQIKQILQENYANGMPSGFTKGAPLR